jgi:steroid delta-isomerase-like uncharacterized protein
VAIFPILRPLEFAGTCWLEVRKIGSSKLGPAKGDRPTKVIDMSVAENKQVIRDFLEVVINQGHLGHADALVKSDFVELDPLPGQGPGREGLKQIIGQLLTSFPDMHWVIDEMVAEDDKVMTRFHWTGTHQGTFLGIPATGKHVTVNGVVIDRLEDGMMADSRILMNNLSMMQQLGVIPMPQG